MMTVGAFALAALVNDRIDASCRAYYASRLHESEWYSAIVYHWCYYKARKRSAEGLRLRAYFEEKVFRYMHTTRPNKIVG
jgi:hypothetical protein